MSKKKKAVLIICVVLLALVLFAFFKHYKQESVAPAPIEILEPSAQAKIPEFQFPTPSVASVAETTTQILNYPSQVSEDVCTPLTPPPNLSAQLDRFNCSKGILDLDSGFDRCKAEIRYSIEFNCKPKSTTFAELSCELQYETENNDSYIPSRSTAYERKSLYPGGMKFDSGWFEMNISLYSIMSPIVRVKPTRLTCRINTY